MVLAFKLLQLPGPFLDLGFIFGRQTVTLAQGASSGLSVRIGDAATRPQSACSCSIGLHANGGSMVTRRYWPKVTILDRGQRVRHYKKRMAWERALVSWGATDDLA